MAGESPAIGELLLDRYRVAEKIAAGGHSVVFRGLDERLNRPVCIKVYSGLGGESGVGRTSYEHFVQEAFALSRLTHPHTLRIYDFGHLGTGDTGLPVQVCEFMNGGTLADVIRERGAQSLAETTSLVAAMCEALGEAHSLRIIHRDIKPQNILFGTVGQTRLPKLADFGIAKWTVDDGAPIGIAGQRAEDTQIVAGQKLAMYSPSWAAPEQLAGQPVTPATDIYSLAAVAVYMLTTQAVFSDEDVYSGYRKRRHGAEVVRDALAPYGVPEAVAAVLTRALAFEVGQRIGSVAELAHELAAAVAPPAPPAPQRSGFLPAQSFVMSIEPDRSRSPTEPPPPAPVAAPEPAAAAAPAFVPLALSATTTAVGDRRVHFAMMTLPYVDLVGAASQQKVRITQLPSPTGRVIHLKGMSCFVQFHGGRPSPAVTLEQPADITLVTPNKQEVGSIQVAFGQPAAGATVFPLGAVSVAIAVEDCADPILFDFGPGSDAYFVYTRGRVAPRARR